MSNTVDKDDDDSLDGADDATYFAEMERRAAATEHVRAQQELQPVVVHGAHGESIVVYARRPIAAPPVPGCFYIDPKTCRLLVGAYPRIGSRELDTLIDAGVRLFINMTPDAWTHPACRVIHVPVDPRGTLSDEAVVDLCRDITVAVNDETTKVYVHSELGCGRVAPVAALLLHALESTDACHTIDLLQAMRQLQCAVDADAAFLPMPESDAQRCQIARLLRGTVDDGTDAAAAAAAAEEPKRRPGAWNTARGAREKRVLLLDNTVQGLALETRVAAVLRRRRRDRGLT